MSRTDLSSVRAVRCRRHWRLALSLPAIAAVAGLAAGCDLLLSNDAKVKRAEQEMSEGDYSRAMAYAKSVLQDAPDHADARLVLGEISVRVGDEETALKELDRALASGADAVQVRARRYEALVAAEKFDELLAAVEKDDGLDPAERALFTAIAYAGLGRSEEAAAAFEKAHSLAPRNPEVIVAHARFLAGSQDWNAAAQAVAEALEIAPRSAEAWAVRGTIDFSRGRYEAARDALAKAVELGAGQLTWPEQMAVQARLTEANLSLHDLKAADESLKGLRARWPNHPQTRFLAARVAAERRDYDTATAELQRVLQQAPENPAARVLLGAVFLAAGKLGQAEATLSSLVSDQPDHLEARKLLAQVYLASNRPQEARTVLAEAESAAAGADSRLQWLLGAALIGTGNQRAGVESLERGVAADPDNHALRMDLAAVYLTAGRNEEARSLLEGMPSAAGGARLQSLRVLAATRGVRPEQVRAEIERLVKETPDNAALLANAGIAMLVAASDPQRARELLGRSLSLDGSQASVRFALAALAMQEGRAEEADQQLRAILEADPKNERASLALAENAHTQGDAAQARKILEQAIGADPQVVESRLQLARLAYLSGNPADGRSLIEQAATAAPEKTPALAAAGKVLLNIGRYDEALSYLRKAMDAGSVDARLDAARAHWALSQKDAARQVLLAGVASRPDWYSGLAMLAQLDAREGRIDAALSHVATARKKGRLAPAAIDIVEGDVRMIGGQPAEAAALYRRAASAGTTSLLTLKEYVARKAAGAAKPEALLVEWLRQHPGDAPVRRALASHYMTSGERSQAIREYETIASSIASATDAISWNNLAWLYHEVKDSRALQTAEKARELAPSSPAVLDTYGWILLQSGQADEARRVLEQAQQKAPGNAEIRYHLGAAYAKTGSRDQAITQLEGALTEKVGAPWRSDAEKLLSELKR